MSKRGPRTHLDHLQVIDHHRILDLLLIGINILTGKKLIVFIDDMNMPQVDTYGTQQPIALLKLLLEKGGMYDRGKDLNWKSFKDIFFIAAMGKVLYSCV